MVYYKRILYMDYYENGIKQTNAGFVKFIQWKRNCDDIDEETTCLQLFVSNIPLSGDFDGVTKLLKGCREVSLGKVKLTDGKGILQIKKVQEPLLDEDISDICEEILLRVELSSYQWLQCVISTATKNVERKVSLKAAEVSEVDMQEEGSLESGEVELKKAGEEEPEPPALMTESPLNSGMEIESSRKLLRIRRDKWQQLWVTLGHIQPYDDEREYIQLELKDLIILPKLYYRLVENSFLLHGYYNYGHLILTKIYKRGVEKIYIGVPGNYYEKEKQVAVMFGFESFEPKAEPAMEGDFGYYMIGVDI